jgi:hypothetical protein
MSEENVGLVRSVLEPLSGINVAELDWGTEAVGEMLGRAYSPDIELRTLDIPLGLDIRDSYHGLDGLVAYLRAWLEPFSEYHVENLDYIEAAIASWYRVGNGVSAARAAPGPRSSSPPCLSCGTARSR